MWKVNYCFALTHGNLKLFTERTYYERREHTTTIPNNPFLFNRFPAAEHIQKIYSVSSKGELKSIAMLFFVTDRNAVIKKAADKWRQLHGSTYISLCLLFNFYFSWNRHNPSNRVAFANITREKKFFSLQQSQGSPLRSVHIRFLLE